MHESRHGATRKIGDAAKLVEMVCERSAERQGRSLPARFWLPEHPEWARMFRRQLASANSLLKLFSPIAVMKALEDNPRVRSLGTRFFLDMVRDAQRALDGERGRAMSSPPIEVRDTTERPRGSAVVPGSIRDRLSRLDGTEEGGGDRQGRTDLAR